METLKSSTIWCLCGPELELDEVDTEGVAGVGSDPATEDVYIWSFPMGKPWENAEFTRKNVDLMGFIADYSQFRTHKTSFKCYNSA